VVFDVDFALPIVQNTYQDLEVKEFTWAFDHLLINLPCVYSLVMDTLYVYEARVIEMLPQAIQHRLQGLVENDPYAIEIEDVTCIPAYGDIEVA
jgi:hypothetical protein